MKCQKCSGPLGECQSFTDNGVSVECIEQLKVCMYAQDAENHIFRNCGFKYKDEEKCHMKRNKEPFQCKCDTDNCNKDNQCDCSSESNKPQNPVPKNQTTSVAIPRFSTTINTTTTPKTTTQATTKTPNTTKTESTTTNPKPNTPTNQATTKTPTMTKTESTTENTATPKPNTPTSQATTTTSTTSSSLTISFSGLALFISAFVFVQDVIQ